MARGIIFPGLDIDLLPKAAAYAEEHNYDSYWVTESRGQDSFVRLATVALATSRITIGSGIAYAFSRHPFAAAGAAADLDQLSGGRLILGLGAGTKYQRKLWYDVDWEHPAPLMKEYVELMKATWSASDPPRPVKYDGKFLHADIARFGRANMARPSIPVYAAALNPGMIRFAAEAYDGIALFPLAITKQYFDQVVMPNVEIGARRAGKSPGDVKIAAWLLTAVNNDPAEAFRASQHHLAFYFSTRSYGAVADLCGFAAEKDRVLQIASANRGNPDLEGMAGAISPAMVDAMTLTGTPDEVRQKIGEFESRVDSVIIEGDRSGDDPMAQVRFTIEALGR